MLGHIHKACGVHPLFDLVTNVEVHVGLHAGGLHLLAPRGEWMVAWKFIQLGFEVEAGFMLLEPASWFQGSRIMCSQYDGRAFTR